MKKSLQNVTLVAVSGLEIEAHIKALEFSCKSIDFGRVLLLAPLNPYPEHTFYDFTQINGFSDVGEWGRFICFELYKYITTDTVLVMPCGHNYHNDCIASWIDNFCICVICKFNLED